MANDPFTRKTASAITGAGQRATSLLVSSRIVSRLMTLAGILIVLVYWRQTGGW